METSPLWSVELVRAIQGWGDWLQQPMSAITTLGAPDFFLALILLIYWCLHKRTGVELAALLMFSGFLNVSIKAFAQRPRPYWLDPAVGRDEVLSFSFPSGHAQSSAALFGYLALVSWRRHRRALAVLAVCAIPLVALSRVALGVHFPGDVLVGMAVGLGLLGLFAWLGPGIARRLAALSLPVQLGLAFLAAAVTVLIALVGLSLSPPATLPAERYGPGAWATLVEASELAGMVLGFWGGVALERRYVRFRVGAPAWKRAVRYAAGVVVVALVWFGLAAGLAGGPSVSGLAMRAARGFIVAGWAAFLWPWLFVRLRLAEGSPTAEPLPVGEPA